MVKMNDVYIEMVKKHPIQEEWKPKEGDKTNIGILSNGDIYYASVTNISIRNTHFWLPRQEDWQRTYQVNKDGYASPKMLDDWKTKHRYNWINVSTRTHMDMWLILWCLYVSHEVYNLEYNWEDKRWVKS